MRRRFLYNAFGLTIASEIALDELRCGQGTPDVEIVLGTVDGDLEHTDTWTIVARPGDVRARVAGAGRFQVRDGRLIVAQVQPDADDRAIRMAIVGPLLGVMLAQRGRFVLHGSSVMVGDVAVSFFGASGAGKSTLAAAMVRAGCELLADDLTVIDVIDRQPHVSPGFPRIKLWPDSARALDRDPDTLPLIHPNRAKRSVRIEADDRAKPIPLARCYMLATGSRELVRTLSPMTTITTLVRSTYQSSWLTAMGTLESNLRHCQAIAASGVVRSLERRVSFESLDDVIRCIRHDVSTACRAAGAETTR